MTENTVLSTRTAFQLNLSNSTFTADRTFQSSTIVSSSFTQDVFRETTVQTSEIKPRERNLFQQFKNYFTPALLIVALIIPLLFSFSWLSLIFASMLGFGMLGFNAFYPEHSFHDIYDSIENSIGSALENNDPDCTSKPIIHANRKGKVYGDPIFEGFEGKGEYFNIRGKANRTYNLLSDKDIQVNSKFISAGGKETNLGDIGIKIRQHRIHFKDDSGTPSVNGVELAPGSIIVLDKGETIIWDGYNLRVITKEYRFKVSNNKLEVKTGSKGVFSDGVMPHGLLGQTADLDGIPRINYDTFQGEGVIDGTYHDYEVSDLFANNFRFNRNIHH